MAKKYSQNGYEAGNIALIANYGVPGADNVRVNLRKGDVSVVLLDMMAWYNKHIEPLRQSDTGGYNYRPIEGSSSISNHGSGTANDNRWRDHPLGAANTFTQEEKDKINDRLRYYEGVIRWGQNYQGRKDGMHFEINKGPSEVARVADKIRRDSAPPRKMEYITIMNIKVPLLQEGDDDAKLPSFNRINRIQAIVGAKPDGIWGKQTTAAIARFMKRPESQCRKLDEFLYCQIFGLEKTK